MSMTVGAFKTNVTGMLHGGTLNKVRNFESAMQRAANTLLMQIDPIDTMRTLPLANTVHDNEFTYPLPSDFKKLIDLYPQVRRQLFDTANRNLAERFDLRKMLVNKTLSIEGSDGTKIIRINWKTRQPQVLNQMNGIDENGLWTPVGSASNVKTDPIDFVSGNGSVKFNLNASGDGIQNTTMQPVDMTVASEVGDFFAWLKIKNSVDLAKVTSASLFWGNDLTTNFWEGIAQSEQADGTAFQVGWNQIMVPWSTATEIGAVDPSAISAAKITLATTGAPITQINVDNITCAIGRNFELKEYSKFVIKDSVTGAWKPMAEHDDDIIVLDDDCIQIYILETIIACAQQMEGTDSGFDINWAKGELNGNAKNRIPGLYSRYRAQYPSQSKQAINYYGSSPLRRLNQGVYGYNRFR